VPRSGRELGSGYTLPVPERQTPMAKVMRVEVGDAGGFAGAGHTVLRRIGREAREDTTLCRAVFECTRLLDFLHEPAGHLRPAWPPRLRRLFTQTEAALGDIDVTPFQTMELADTRACLFKRDQREDPAPWGVRQNGEKLPRARRVYFLIIGSRQPDTRVARRVRVVDVGWGSVDGDIWTGGRTYLLVRLI
jgi:hypothetical protein